MSGVNVIKRHTKPNPGRNIKGGIVERELPVDLSNLALIDPETKRISLGLKQLEQDYRRAKKQASASKKQ